MNIFAVDSDTTECARWLDDSRLRKMIVETVQIISTAEYICGGDISGLYKPTHIHHPVNKWASNSSRNTDWLILLFLAYKDEYLWRIGRWHKTFNYTNRLLEIYCGDLYPQDFPNCTRFKDRPTFEAVKCELHQKWREDRLNPHKSNPKWTKRV